MSARARIGLVSVLAALNILAVSEAHAQRVVHRARFGETLGSIADLYYGAKKHAQFIKLINGQSAQRLRAGQRIRVPTAWYYTTPKRTTVGNLAKRLLKDRRRDTTLRAFNRLGKRRRRVAAGTRLLVPFMVSHLVKAGETFAAISKRYYGKTTNAALIAKHNLVKGQPKVDALLEIPIARVRITPLRLRQLTNFHVLGVSPQRREEDRAALQESNGMIRAGEYWRVPLRLIRLLSREQPSDTYIAEVFKLLAIAYVAVGQQELAVSAFQEALLRHPTFALDPVSSSPKVIRAYTDAKRQR